MDILLHLKKDASLSEFALVMCFLLFSAINKIYMVLHIESLNKASFNFLNNCLFLPF